MEIPVLTLFRMINLYFQIKKIAGLRQGMDYTALYQHQQYVLLCFFDLGKFNLFPNKETFIFAFKI